MVTEKKPTRIRKTKPKVQRQFIVDEAGQRTAVILPIQEYEALLEDLYDLGLIAEARDEPSFSLEEMEERLRKNGVLPS